MLLITGAAGTVGGDLVGAPRLVTTELGGCPLNTARDRQITKKYAGISLASVAEDELVSYLGHMSEEREPGLRESPAAAALRRLGEALDELAALDLDAESERELCEATVGLQAQCNRLDVQRLRLLEGVDRREAHREDAGVTAASWLRWRCRLDHAESTRLAQAARQRLPAMTAALEVGGITLSHLLAATAAGNTAARLEAVAASDDTLAELAQAAWPRQVKTAVARIRDAVDGDGSGGEPSHLDEHGRDRRRIDDLGHLDATLDAETSELLAALLDALSTPDPPGTPEDQRRGGAADPGEGHRAGGGHDGAVADHPCRPPLPHPAAVAAAVCGVAAPPLPRAGV